MSNDTDQNESWIHKYKELIVTTVICLFLTGIYDSLNTQNQKIDKWYRTMIKLQGQVNINQKDLQDIESDLDDHEGRIRHLEGEVTPWVSEQRRRKHFKDSLEDSTDVIDS